MSGSSTILVTNISTKANDKAIADFFSFCGKISSIKVKRENETVEAIIEFDTEAAATTALLLTNALIVDKPITVQRIPNLAAGASGSAPPSTPAPLPTETQKAQAVAAEPHSAEADKGFQEMDSDSIPVRAQSVPDEERSHTSVIASLIAGGYTLGEDTVEMASRWDNENEITKKIQAGFAALGQKTHELDEAWGISAKTKEGWQAFTNQVTSLSQSIGLPEKSAAASTAIGAQVNAATEKITATTEQVMQTPTMQSITSTLSGWTQSLGSLIQPVINNVNEELNEINAKSQHIIEEEHKKKEQLKVEGGTVHETEHGLDPLDEPRVEGDFVTPKDDPIIDADNEIDTAEDLQNLQKEMDQQPGSQILIEKLD